MKRVKYGIFIVIVICFLTACSKKGDVSSIMDYVMVDIVSQISVTSQGGTFVENRVIEENLWERLFSIWGSFSLELKKSCDKNGWEYLFVIEQSNGKTIQLSFGENLVRIGNSVYELTGYDSDDFLFLFDKSN